MLNSRYKLRLRCIRCFNYNCFCSTAINHFISNGIFLILCSLNMFCKITFFI
nr:MAG TPA: hypothetical protein [Caudoviricetes sp.]